jgi:tripartite-type tricarboxylate transporter receptor subunit TctC
LCVGAVAAGIAPWSIGIARAAEFYAGKTVTVICGYNPGGGVDLITRLIASQLGKFIPGAPRIIVQNMEGASGIVAANHIAVRAPQDGTVLAVPGRDWLLKPLLGFNNTRFDPQTLRYIGSTGATNAAAFIRADTGIRSAADLRKAPRKILFGGVPGTTLISAVPKLLQQRGWPVEVITGYGNTSRILYAMEQKEVDAIYTPESSFSRRRDLLDTGAVLILFQTLQRIPGKPTAASLVDDKDRALMALAHGQAVLGTPLVAPPGTPPDRVELLRSAFMAMCADPPFQEQARAIDEPIDEPLSGAAIQAGVRDMIAGITPEVVEAYGHL